MGHSIETASKKYYLTDTGKKTPDFKCNKVLFLFGSFFLSIGISSLRRRLSELEADGQKTEDSVNSVPRAERAVKKIKAFLERLEFGLS